MQPTSLPLSEGPAFPAALRELGPSTLETTGKCWLVCCETRVHQGSVPGAGGGHILAPTHLLTCRLFSVTLLFCL